MIMFKTVTIYLCKAECLGPVTLVLRVLPESYFYTHRWLLVFSVGTQSGNEKYLG